MTYKEKLIKIKSLADKMYDAAFNLTTDASLLRKAMDDYHQFIINEYHKEEQIIKELQEEPEPQFKVGDTIRSKVWERAVHEIVYMDDSAYFFENGGKVRFADQEQWELVEEPISEKKCVFIKDNYTDGDRMVLCEDCKDRCAYAIAGVISTNAQLKKEPVSKELIDVAKQYVKEHVIGIDKVTFSIATDMFISGANWQEKKDQEIIETAIHHAYHNGRLEMKEQMITEAVNGIARPDDGEIWCNLKSFNFKDGDKVKVIVIKED